MKVLEIFLILKLLVSILNYINSSVIGIDLGSEFIKVAIVKNERSILMVENLQSKTKTPFAIGFRDQERTFGSDAAVKKSKFPDQVFVKMHDFLGKKYNDDWITKILKEYFISYNVFEDDERKTIIFGINKESESNKFQQYFSLEEIYAMIFRYINFISSKYDQSDIKECVVTVPAFFGYKERLSLAQAVEISGMKLLHIVSENTGAAVNYGMNQVFGKNKKNTYIILYNMGSSYTQASLISYRSRYEFHPKDKNKTIEHQYVSMVDETWERNLGGRNFDFKIVRELIKMFSTKHSKHEVLRYLENDSQDLEDNQNINKIAEKILPSAIKYKEILSANRETNIHILGVDEGLNLDGTLSRAEFEKISRSEIFQSVSPIVELLKRNNNITIDEISSIEFIGGGNRIPMIKDIFKKHVPLNKIGSHMNGDDCFALGTAFIAGNLTSSGLIYNNKKIDLTNYGTNFQLKIKITHFQKETDLCEDNFQEIALNCVRSIKKEAIIFKSRSGFSLNKIVNFKHDSDFLVQVYEYFDFDKRENHITNFQIKVNEKISKIVNENGFSKNIPRIMLKFSLDKLGVLSLKAELGYDIIYYLKMIKDSKGFYSFKHVTEKIEPLSAMELIDEISKVNAHKNITKSEKERINKKLKNEVGKSKNETKKIQLDVTEEYIYPKQLTKNQVIKSRVKLNNLDSMDQERAINAEKRNQIESILYSKRDWIESEDSLSCGKESELEIFKKELGSIQSWYEDEGYKANASHISEKISQLNNAFKIFENRLELHRKRTVAIDYFYSEMNSTIREGKKILDTKPWALEYFNGEFTEKISQISDWFEELKNKQANLNLYEESVLKEEEIYTKLDNLKVEIKKLRRIPKPLDSLKNEI